MRAQIKNDYPRPLEITYLYPTYCTVGLLATKMTKQFPQNKCLLTIVKRNEIALNAISNEKDAVTEHAEITFRANVFLNPFKP